MKKSFRSGDFQPDPARDIREEMEAHIAMEAEALMEALEAGRFYASTGVELEEATRCALRAMVYSDKDARIIGTLAETYAYDANGNRTHVNGVLVGTYDDQDRIVEIAGPVTEAVPDGVWVRYSYDDIGNLAAVPIPRWYVLGTKGALLKNGLDPQEKAMVAGDIDAAVEAERQAKGHKGVFCGAAIELKDGRLWVFRQGSEDQAGFKRAGRPGKRI